MKISKEKVVLMNYTLKNDAGEFLDSSEGREPLAFIHGLGMLIPGLENELEGKEIGEKLNVTVAPENAYGTRNEELVQIAKKEHFNEPEEVQVGVQFQMEGPMGQPMVATITKIEGDDVTIDLNHPLADMTLHFDVEILEVRDASEEELASVMQPAGAAEECCNDEGCGC